MKQCVDSVVTLLFQNPPNTFSGGVLGVQTPTHNVFVRLTLGHGSNFTPHHLVHGGPKKLM